MDERTSSAAQWQQVTAEEWAQGIRLAISHFKPITHVSIHRAVARARSDLSTGSWPLFVCNTRKKGF